MAEPTPTETTLAESQAAESTSNPFFQKWDTPFGIPPFSEIKDEHYRPAFEVGIAEYQADLARIRNNSAPPSFANTVLALEQAGPLLGKVRGVFNNAINTGSNEYLVSLDLELQEELSKESAAEYLDEQIFRRLETLYKKGDLLPLSAVDKRLLLLKYLAFQRSGAGLDPTAKARLIAINAELASLGVRFASNVLQSTRDFVLVVEDENRLGGLSAGSKSGARRTAEQLGNPEAWMFGLSRSVFENFMAYAQDSDLRRQMLAGYEQRGTSGDSSDNRKIVERIVTARAERAELLGYESYADFRLQTRMARSPQQVQQFLQQIWGPGLAKARLELTDMQVLKSEDGYSTPLEASDWWYYARKLRRDRYQVTELEIRAYFQLDQVREGAFWVAEQLFGIRFQPLENAPRWHPDVQLWAAFSETEEFLGIYMADYFTRKNKRGGAWKSSYRPESDIDGISIRPIVANNFNLTPPVANQPVLLNLREVKTLFHEFGHALHSLLSRGTYPSMSGSAGTPRDYREFPSQFFERYATDPGVLNRYAKNYETGEPISSELVSKIQAISSHNQGFQTTESIAAAMLDLNWHTLGFAEAAVITDVLLQEKLFLDNLGPLPEIGPRYRSPYFSHVFSGSYSAGYYAYLWSEVLDADGFSAFTETGNIFDPELARRLKKYIYEAGASEDADVLYRKFRGRDPDINAFLQFRGLEPVEPVKLQ